MPRAIAAAWVAVFASAVLSCELNCREYDGCAEFVGGAGRGAGSSGTGGNSGEGFAGIGGVTSDGGSSGEAGADGATFTGGVAGGESPADAGAGGTNCAGEPGDSSCTDDDDAIFVALTGNDDNAGTRAAPLRSLAAALALAHAERKVVRACRGEYTENLVLSRELYADLQGGYECSNGWVHAGAQTTVEPATGIPLRVDGLERDVRIENFVFRAPPGSAPAESSIAALVTRSDSTLAFINVELVAQSGADAEDAAPQSVDVTEFAMPGNAASGLAGGAQIVCPCESLGGRGGDGGTRVQPGRAGEPLLDESGGGIVGLACNQLGGGGPGADGVAAPPATGASTPGELDAEGNWQPASGEDGARGGVAQGGGGGRGGRSGGGGGGGCGGCGGYGGRGGAGGGASIGLIAVDAVISLERSSIQTEQGGHGAGGAPGQPGEPGGPGGSSAPTGCPGGEGGTGAPGAAGGGGAGGVSVGILRRGGDVVVGSDTAIFHGRGGRGGQRDSDEEVSVGVDGYSGPTLVL